MRSRTRVRARKLTVLLSCAAVGMLVTATPAAAAPPANDDFDSPTPVAALPFSDSIDVSEATRAIDDPSCAGEDGHTVWYSFTAAQDAAIVASTAGSDFDTTLSAYTGGRGALTQVACNDDSGGGLQSRVQVSLTAGDTVSFMAGAYPGNPGGSLVFSVDVAPPARANDDFDDASVIDSLPYSDSVDLTQATPSGDDPVCRYSGTNTAWYSFTLEAGAQPAVARAQALSGGSFLMLSAYVGTRGSLTQLACGRDNFPRIQVTLAPGQTVYFMLAAFPGEGSDAVFSLDFAPPGPANDDIDGATTIGALPFTDTVDASLATHAVDDPDSACSFEQDPPFSATLWYRFTAATAVRLDVGTPDSDFTAILSAFQGTSGSLAPIACGAERMQVQVGAGETIYIMIGGSPEAFDNLIVTADVSHPLAPGDLDPTFGGDGRVIHVIGRANAGFANDVVVLDGGRIVAASGVFLPNSESGDFGLVGLWPDGRLDPSFGDHGVVATDFGDGRGDDAIALAVQTDGKIIAAGTSFNFFVDSSSSVALARYLPDGSLDPAFGTAGKVLAGSSVLVADVAVQADGRIVVLGSLRVCDPDVGGCAFHGFVLARFMTNGALDPTFGDEGIVTTDFGDEEVFARALAIQPDGRILAAAGGSGRFLLVRYLPGGTIDVSFGRRGLVRTAIGRGSAYPAAMVVQNNGLIVVAGAVLDGSTSKFALARYMSSGALDRRFGDHGIAVTSFGRGVYAAASDLLVQPDAKIVVAGTVSLSINAPSFGLARYQPGGGLDRSFGDRGRVVTSNTGVGYGLAIQPDGKLVVAGCGGACAADEPGMVFARYVP